MSPVPRCVVPVTPLVIVTTNQAMVGQRHERFWQPIEGFWQPIAEVQNRRPSFTPSSPWVLINCAHSASSTLRGLSDSLLLSSGRLLFVFFCTPSILLSISAAAALFLALRLDFLGTNGFAASVLAWLPLPCSLGCLVAGWSVPWLEHS